MLIIFLTPLVSISSILGYEQAKVFFFLSSTLTGGIFYFFKFSKSRFVFSNINKASLTFLIILLLTSIGGIDLFSSIVGRYPYFQGLTLYLFLYLFYLLVVSSKVNLILVSFALSGSSFLVAFLAIKDWILMHVFHIPIVNYAGRVVSTFGQPNFYSGFLLLTIPFIYYLLVKSQGYIKLLILTMLAISSLAIIVSESRTAAALLLFLIYIWLVFQLKKYWFQVIVLSVVVVISSILISSHFGSGILWKQLTGLSLADNLVLNKDYVNKRPYIWVAASQLYFKEPISGYGLENISLAFNNYFMVNEHMLFEENVKVSPVLLSLKDLVIDRTHNYPLDILLFSGVFGFCGWIGLIIVIFRKILISKVNLENNMILTGLITYLLWIQIQNPSIVHLLYFCLITGLIDQETLT